jgi:hypothetical protein
VQNTDTDEAFDEIAEAQKSYLRECALLLLGAMGEDGAFPTDVGGVTALSESAVDPERGHRGGRFAAESPDDPPLLSGEGLVWVSPVDDEALRLRIECGFHASLAVVLRSDGQLGQFIELEARGAPEPGPNTEAQALFDHDDESRFNTEHLVGVRSAPRNDLAGLVVTWIALYDSGVVIHYLAPGSEDEGEGPIKLRDDLGTSYSPVGLGDVDLAVPPLRSLEFAPAVPPDASRLTIASVGGSVEIPMVD